MHGVTPAGRAEGETADPDSGDSWAVRHERDLGLVREFHQGGLILEIGCWPYSMTRLLLESRFEVIGLDLDPDRGDTGNLPILRCDVERDRFPVEDGSVRTALACEVIEHLGHDALHMLEECWRVLAPGGILILTTPNLYAAYNTLQFLCGRGLRNSPYRLFRRSRLHGHMSHIREYAPCEIREMVRACGFEVIRHRLRDLGGSRLKAALHRMLPGFAPNQELICRKPRGPSPDRALFP